uniref:Variant surface glycoprotein n=1 Tax=Trypanosoma brucei TaxID=5691 RepID=A0A1V0G0C4_9TRYP|nr:variant surface glycoprotein [Trypanosoma brucei]
MTQQGCEVQNKISLLFLILNTYTLGCGAESKTIDDDSLADTVSNACDAMQYIAAKAAACEDTVNSVTSAIADNLVTANTWAILEAKETGDKKLAYAALSAAATEYVAKQLRTLQPHIKVCQQQSETINRRIGVTTMATELNKQALGTDGKIGIKSNDPTNGGKIDIPTTLVAAAANACKIEDRGTVGNTKHKLGKAKQTKIALVADSILQTPNPATKPGIQCKHASGGTDPQWTSSGQSVGCSATTQPGEIHTALSTSKLFNTLTVTTPKLSDDSTDNCKGGVDISKMTWPTDEHVKFVICQAQTITATPEQSLKDMSLDTLRSKTQLDAAVAAVLGLTKEQRREMEPHIKRLFGTDTSKFTEIFLTAPAKTSTKYGMPEESSTKAIGELAQEENYVTALVHLKKTNNEKIIAGSQASKPQASEPECKNKDKDDCASEKCELKGDKCVAKEEAKVENDGKTTNTTGSNSFVIKASPLWLAFLLF